MAEPWNAYDTAAATYFAAGEDDPVWRERYRQLFRAKLVGRRMLDLG
jgi:hypothetical protein